MPDTRLILGGIAFRDFEVPSKINFGGKQRLQTHKLVGGYRVVDALGPEPDDIKWSGRFRGEGALSRARRLDRLRAAGAQVPLTWGGLAYLVTVEHFKAEFERFYEIPYEITCKVIADSVGGLSIIGVIGGLIGDITGGLAAVSGPISAEIGGVSLTVQTQNAALERLLAIDLQAIGERLEALP